MPRPLFFLTVPLILGMILGYHWIFPPLTLFCITLALLLLTALGLTWRQPRGERIINLALIGTTFSFGIFWLTFNFEKYPPQHIRNLPRLFHQEAEYTGRITSDPEAQKYHLAFEVNLEQLNTQPQSFLIQGRVRVLAPLTQTHLNYGDRVRLYGVLKHPRAPRNPGAFDYPRYLLFQGVYAILSVADGDSIEIVARRQGNFLFQKVIFPLRHFLLKRITKYHNNSTANMVKALLLGERQEVEPELVNALSQTGTSHILAVSGLHTGFILAILLLIFKCFRLPNWLGTGLTILGLVLFAALTDLKSPVVRASIMAVVFLMGAQLQKMRDGFNTLALAALIILLIQPLELFNPGFQLSFGAVASIIYFLPKFLQYIELRPMLRNIYHIRWLRYPLDIVLVSLAVQLGTLPIVLYYFYNLPFLGVLANILVIPLIAMILALGLIVVVVSFGSTFIATCYAEANQLLVQLLSISVKYFAQLPASHFYVPQPHLSWIFIYYATLLMYSQWSHLKVRKWGLVLVLAGLNWATWQAALTDEKLKIIHFDVDQGDATLIQYPNGPRILIDGGKTSPDFDCGARILMPYLRQQGLHYLDYVIMTHPHNDHIGGLLYILKNFKIGQIWDNGLPYESPLYATYRHLIDSLKIPHHVVRAGEVIQPVAASEIWVVASGDLATPADTTDSEVNNNSVVIRLKYGAHTFLFCADAEQEVESGLSRFGPLLRSQVMKIGHHGSQTSSTVAFLDQIQPQIGVISVGARNQFRHPSPQVIWRLREKKVQILRTDYSGAIVFESDGSQLDYVQWKDVARLRR